MATDYKSFKEKALSRADVKAEYDRLAPEYTLEGQLIKARIKQA